MRRRRQKNRCPAVKQTEQRLFCPWSLLALAALLALLVSNAAGSLAGGLAGSLALAAAAVLHAAGQIAGLQSLDVVHGKSSLVTDVGGQGLPASPYYTTKWGGLSTVSTYFSGRGPWAAKAGGCPQKLFTLFLKRKFRLPLFKPAEIY